jgi:hypothetical protein
LWFCVVLCGFVWFCVVLCGFVWFCVVLCGCVWFCVVLYGFVWFCVMLTTQNNMSDRCTASNCLTLIPLSLQIGLLLGSFVGLLIDSSNQIKSNAFPELNFQQQGSGFGMHLHYLPKERLQSAPRALQKMPLHPILSFSLMFNKNFKCSQCSFCSCNLAKTWV